jgi:hypothetical protein
VRRPGLLLASAAAIVLCGAGLSLAQNTFVPPDTASDQPPPGTPPAPAATPPEAAPQPTDIPPPEEAPPPPPEATAPPSPPPQSATNTTASANTVDATPAPPPPPPKRPRYASVVLQALDKVTAETLRFEAKVGEPVRYKDLVISVQACETQAADEPYAQTAAHLEVQYQPEIIGGRAPEVARQVFRGWMFGEAPGLNPFEHPIYDLWVIACKTPSAADGAKPAAAPPPVAGASL